jgi:NADH-ubiquinone oxidoreductase chain 3
MSSMIFLYLFVSILALAFLAINFLFASHNPYLEKDSIFECGFHSFRDQNRQPFHVLFYMYAMLYLLFDLELTLIGPYTVSQFTNEAYGFVVMALFTGTLCVGLIFEIGQDALNISNGQSDKEIEKLNSPTNHTIEYLKTKSE